MSHFRNLHLRQFFLGFLPIKVIGLLKLWKRLSMQWEIHVLQVQQLSASPLTFREILVCEQTVPPCPDHIVSHYGNRIGVRTVGIVTLKVRVASREGARDSLSHCPSAQTSPADMPQTGNKASSIFCMPKASLFSRSSFCLSWFVSFVFHSLYSGSFSF